MIVVSAAGVGLVNMMRNEYKTSAASEIRHNLNHATEFISDEARQAKRIIKSKDGIDTSSIPADEALPKNAQIVLAIELPNYRDQIIYYTAPADNPWLPPRVLYRWGPDINENGKYVEVDANGKPFDKVENVKSDTKKVTNVNWNHSPLADMLVATESVRDKDCDGWNQMPPEADFVDGFFVCVNNDENLVRLRMASEVVLTSYAGGKPEKEIYSTDTKIFARLGGENVGESTGSPYKFYPTTDGQPPKTVCEQTNCEVTVNEIKRPPSSDPNKPVPTECKGECYVSLPSSIRDLYEVTVTNIPAKKGDYVSIKAPAIHTDRGNTRRQTVEVLTNADSLPDGITLADNQVLYILTSISNKKVFHIIVTFN
jgi:hypothetical protein